MNKRIDRLRKLGQVSQLAAEAVKSAAGGRFESYGGTYLTSSFALRGSLPNKAKLRKMSNAVACRLAELGFREPISLRQLPDYWWKVKIDAAELGLSSEYGCAYVTRMLSSRRLTEIGFEVIDGPFQSLENGSV